MSGNTIEEKDREIRELKRKLETTQDALAAAHNVIRRHRDADSSFTVDQPDGELRHG